MQMKLVLLLVAATLAASMGTAAAQAVVAPGAPVYAAPPAATPFDLFAAPFAAAADAFADPYYADPFAPPYAAGPAPVPPAAAGAPVMAAY